MQGSLVPFQSPARSLHIEEAQIPEPENPGVQLFPVWDVLVFGASVSSVKKGCALSQQITG